MNEAGLGSKVGPQCSLQLLRGEGVFKTGVAPLDTASAARGVRCNDDLEVRRAVLGSWGSLGRRGRTFSQTGKSGDAATTALEGCDGVGVGGMRA